MREFEYTITDELGIHARPAGLLVKKAGEFASTVSVDNGTKKGDAKKIMSLMMMGVKKGHTVKFTIEGPDENAAAEALEAFMKENYKKYSKGVKPLVNKTFPEPGREKINKGELKHEVFTEAW